MSDHTPPFKELLNHIQLSPSDIKIKPFSADIEVFLSNHLKGMDRKLAEDILHKLAGEQYLIDSYQDVIKNGFRRNDTDIGTTEQQVRFYKNNIEAIVSHAKTVRDRSDNSSMIEMLIETNDVSAEIGIDEIAEGLYLTSSPYFYSVAKLMTRFVVKELFLAYKEFISHSN